MEISWSADAADDYRYWVETKKANALRVTRLVDAICADPFRGIGKPEPLKESLHGWWSRRITGEHRIVYRVSGRRGSQVLEIAQCRKHY